LDTNDLLTSDHFKVSRLTSQNYNSTARVIRTNVSLINFGQAAVLKFSADPQVN